MLFTTEEYNYNSVGSHIRALLTWRTRTGSSNISLSTTLRLAV